jgi:hypothetical protein
MSLPAAAVAARAGKSLGSAGMRQSRAISDIAITRTGKPILRVVGGRSVSQSAEGRREGCGCPQSPEAGGDDDQEEEEEEDLSWGRGPYGC